MVSYNWGLYLNKQPTPGQLLPYPLNVMPNGELKYLDGVSNFPDFPSSAKVMGKTNPLMPQKVTTWKKNDWDVCCISMQIFNFIQIHISKGNIWFRFYASTYVLHYCSGFIPSDAINNSTYSSVLLLFFTVIFIASDVTYNYQTVIWFILTYVNMFNAQLFLYKFK